MTDDIPSSDTLRERLEDAKKQSGTRLYYGVRNTAEDAIEALAQREEQVERLKAALHERATDDWGCDLCNGRGIHWDDCLLAGFEAEED